MRTLQGSFRVWKCRSLLQVARISRRRALIAATAAALAPHELWAAPATATKKYTASEELFPNPERGFHGRANPPGGGTLGQQDENHPPLTVAALRALRDQPERMSLLRWCVVIPRRFWQEPIAADFLAELQAGFDAAREAGIKLIPRFLYDWGMTNRDPEERIVHRHLDELTPLVRRNTDAIAWMQAGLFGGTGEGCKSDQGFVFDKYDVGGTRWQGLSTAGARLLHHELELLSPERMLTVRYPRLKWDLFGWPAAKAKQRALDERTAFDGGGAARVGIFNDGFMGNKTHYAMFVLPDELAYSETDTGFVVSEGEISDGTPWKLAPGRVVREMSRLHQTALNRDGDDWKPVAAAWKRNGDYDVITRRMGYRLRLVEGESVTESRAGQPAPVRLKMTNDGFGRVLNPRGVALLLRGRNGIVHRQDFERGRSNRLWLPGAGETRDLDLTFTPPASLAAGEYELLLHLPDPAPSLRARPEFAIRLANRDLWEDKTGFHRLGLSLRLKPA
jgi:hypothetical protein